MGKRNKKIKRLIIIFFGVLLLVLVIGIIAMTIYAGYIKQNSDEKRDIVFFEWLEPVRESFTGKKNQSENNDTHGENTQFLESLYGMENEKLYNEAVALGQNVRLIECENEDRVMFAFAGDILLDDNYAMMSNFRARRSSIEDTFSQHLLDIMRSFDVFMLNNEFTFTERGTALKDKTFTFRAKPENVEILKSIGVDVVSLANNHAYDFGEVSLLDTMNTLKSADISYVGAGTNLSEAKKPVYIIANGMKIAIVSATQIERIASPDTKEATENSAGVLRCWDTTALLSVIAEAEANSDFVILYIHWGTENQEEIDWLQEEQAPIYINAGVDLIIGDHPHCLQKIDIISDVPVCYSLGNFWFNSKTLSTCMIEAGIDKEGLKSLRFIPCIQSECRTRQLEGNEKDELLEYMRSISPNIQIDNEGYIQLEK